MKYFQGKLKNLIKFVKLLTEIVIIQSFTFQ